LANLLVGAGFTHSVPQRTDVVSRMAQTAVERNAVNAGGTFGCHCIGFTTGSQQGSFFIRS